MMICSMESLISSRIWNKGSVKGGAGEIFIYFYFYCCNAMWLKVAFIAI